MTRRRVPFTSFRESRLRVGPDGRFYSDEPSLAGEAWHGALAGVDGLRLASRGSPQVSGELPVMGDVSILPDYRGAAGLVRVLPRLLVSIHRLVAESAVVSVRVPGPIGVIATVLARLRRRPVVAEVVGDIGDVIDSGAVGSPPRPLAAAAIAITRWQVRQASAVRYVTHRTLQSRFPSNPSAPSIALSEVRVDVETPMPRGGRAPGFTVVAVGSQEQLYKGHDVLLRALEMVRESIPDARLTLIGDGARRADLEALARDLGLEDHVQFTGFIGDPHRLRSEVAQHDLFVMPSRTEGLPRALIEAMSLGLPSIGTRVGGIPELLPDDVLVPPDDPEALAALIVELAGAPERRAELATECRSRASLFAPERLDAERARWTAAVGALIAGSAHPAPGKPRNYLGSVVALLLSSGVQVGSNLVAAIIATAFLPVDQRGLMVLVVTMAVLSATIAPLGVGNVLRNRLPRSTIEGRERLISAVTTAGLLAAVLAGVGAVIGTLVIAPFADPRLAQPGILAAVAVLAMGQLAVGLLTEMRYAHGEFGSGSRWSAAAAGAALAAVGVGLLIDPSAQTVVAMQAAAVAILALASAVSASRSGVIGGLALQRSELLSLVIAGSRSMVLPLGILLMSRADRLILGALTDASAVAVFALAATAVEVVRIVPTAMGQILTREVAAGADWAHIRRRYRAAVALTIVTAFTITVIAMLLIEPVFGAEYEGAVLLVPILAVAEVLYAVTVLSQLAFIGGGWSTSAMGLGILAVVASITLFPVGIAAGFLVGLSVAKIVAQAAVALASYRTLSGLVERPPIPPATTP